MFRRIANSWELIKASAAVLQADKELIAFPIVSAIGVLLATITFFLPLAFAGAFDALLAGGATVLGIVVLFLFYLVQYFVIIFANSALVGAAMIRLGGGDPTLGDGFRIAFSRFGAILGYALISATVGVVLRLLSERAGSLGRIVVSLVGLAWNIATYLVVPVLVVEEVGPVDAVKRSVSLLRRTWGEQIAGNLSIGLVFGLVALLVGILGVGLIVLAITWEVLALVVAAVVVIVLLLTILALVSSTLSGIYTAAVYQYAVTGETGGFFRQDLVEGAFRRQ
jgi:hypothetical protein